MVGHCNDGIKSRDVRDLTIDEARTLIAVANNHPEHFNDDEGQDLQGILDLYWAAADRDWDGFVAFLEEAPTEARREWARILNRANKRAAKRKAREDGR